MRKYALLLLIVLGIGAPAWGVTQASVCVPGCVSCNTYVKATVRACIPGNCEVVSAKSRVLGNVILVDVFVKCKCPWQGPCAWPGVTPICKEVPLGKFCPGIYSVLANVYCLNVDTCCPQCRSLLGTPTIPCATGAGFFRVYGCFWPLW
jgi:hypothetical protein